MSRILSGITAKVLKAQILCCVSIAALLHSTTSGQILHMVPLILYMIVKMVASIQYYSFSQPLIYGCLCSPLQALSRVI